MSLSDTRGWGREEVVTEVAPAGRESMGVASVLLLEGSRVELAMEPSGATRERGGGERERERGGGNQLLSIEERVTQKCLPVPTLGSLLCIIGGTTC